jgi:hypothetical protein
MTEATSWLYEWLDSYLIATPQQAQKVLQQKAGRESLREAAAEVTYRLPTIDANDRESIVAGARLDLSGQLLCTHWECLKKQVDELFASIWHYFDRAVVVGPSARLISESWETNPEYALDLIDNYIRVLLYIRNIGAESLFIFTEKPGAWCEEHLSPLIEDIGLHSSSELDQYIQTLKEDFLANAELQVRTNGDVQIYSLQYPKYLDVPTAGVRRNTGDPIDRDQIISKVVHENVMTLISDIDTAQSLTLPLASTGRFHELLLRSRLADVAESDVALRLELPVLQGVSPEILMRIRNEEREDFLAFRNALKRAIRERLEASGDPEKTAREIRADLLDPSLNEIRRKLTAAKSALAKKSAVAIGVGAVTTACGLMLANPLMVTTGVGAAMTTVAATQKYLEEKRDISLSDMYFLWHAEGRAQELV